ncbi:E3 ubiquitin-protein ligase TRIM33 isoform X2 [Astatotilapia calliptera]|nr:E3 ubiquitin-protein ligase TRIM33-like isoform X2 [Astatotilapia calliptera]XP_026039913.1 E3 ubiquitin-protein ligase TRIM33-like isoform X2 [Astatotilapia calliptera]
MEATGASEDNLSQQCSNCDAASAACWCLDCNEALCSVCVSAHRRVTVTRSHRLLHHPPEGNILSSPTKFCRLHPSEPLQLICFTCKQLTCRDCQLTTHMNHRYRFVSEAVVSLKKQLDVYVHSTTRQEDTVRRSLQDMETRLQSIEQTESRLRTELQAGFVAFAKLLKAKMVSLLKDIKKVYELECEQIQGRMVKMKQLQQSQMSMKETLEKARNLTDLPTLLSHTAQIKTQMKELLDQDSDPPLKMPEVKLITKLGYEETLSELCNLHVSWIPFAVPPTLDKNTGTPATPAAPPPTSTCNPISSTVMDSASASHSLHLSFTSSSAPTHGTDSTSFKSPSTCLASPGPQTETAGSSATPVPDDCAATPSPSSQSSSSSALWKFSPNLTLYNLLTHNQVGTQDSVNPRSPPSSSPSGQLSHALPPTATSPATSNRPLPPSCNAPGAPTSRASLLCTLLSSCSTSITPPAHTSTFPLPTDSTPQTGKAMNCNPPATTSVLPPPSTSVSAQPSVPLSSTIAMFPSSITPFISTRPSLSALVSSQPTIPPSSTTSMFPHSSTSSYTPSTSTNPVFTGSIAQANTSPDTPVTISSFSSPHLTNQLSAFPPSSLSTPLPTSTCPAATTASVFQTLDSRVTNLVVPDSSTCRPSAWLLPYDQSNLRLSSSACLSSVSPPTVSSTCPPAQISNSPSASPNQFKPLVTHSSMVLAGSPATSSTLNSARPVSSWCLLPQTSDFSNPNLLVPVNSDATTTSSTTINSSSTSPPTSTFAVLTSSNAASPVPVSIPSSLWNSSSTSSSVAFVYSSSATPPSTTCSTAAHSSLLHTSRSLLHTSHSLFPVSSLSTSQIFAPSITPTLSSFISSPSSATSCSSPSYLFLPQTDASRSSVVLSMLPAGSTFPLSAGQFLSSLKPVQPLQVLNQTAGPHWNQPTIVMLTNTQSMYQVLLNETALIRLPDHRAFHPASAQKRSGLEESSITEVSPETSAGNSSCDGPSGTLPSEQQTMEDTSPALPSSPLSSLQEVDSTLHPPSPQEQTQQVPVEGLVVDSRCDSTIQDTEEVQETKETEHATCVSDEAKPNALEPKDDLPTLVTPDKDIEELSAVIGQEDFSLSRWQPKVSVLRLPVSLPRFGRSLPSFRLLPGETEDEIYLEEMSDDCQSDAEDGPADKEDFMKPESSPDSPITLEILACSVCASPGTSIICSACGRGYHRDCHVPPVGLDFWSEWACSLCQNLSDPSDPYSTERLQRTSLSLQSLRRCECLVLHLKVEVCSRCSQFGGLSRLKSISDRLTLRRPPPYQTAAELVSDMWTLFKDASQDDELQKLRESFRMKLVETLSSELHPSLLTAPNSNPQTAAGHASRSQHGREDERLKLEKEEGLIPESKLEDFRKRLRDFLDLKGSPGPKRRKRDDD